MKLKRMVACVLTLLLVVSLLPMTALADTIPDNGPGGEPITISHGETMNKNMGEVEANNGTIKQNVPVNGDPYSGNVFANYGTIEENYGSVCENRKAIENNEYGGVVTENVGTIGTNNGTVEENYGTVKTNGIDGVVYNYNNGGAVAASNDDAIETPTEQPPVVAGVGTNFGTVHNKADGNTYYGLSWGESVDKLNSIESFVLAGDTRNLDEIANGVNREGYKMTGYTAYSRKEGENVVIDDTAGYEMNAPTWLEILWQKLGGKSESKAMVANVPTHVAAGDVQEGTLVRCGNMVFLVIEVGKDYILVTTMSAQSKKDMEDPMAYLAKYLTPEQLALLQGNPEQLSEELAAKFFGGNTNHIVFKAAKNLFA